MIPFPYKQKLITSLATTVSCERNWIITPTSGQKRKYLSLQNNNYNKYGNVCKSQLCPNFLSLPQNSELPKIWRGCSPPPLPGPYAYGVCNLCSLKNFTSAYLFQIAREKSCDYLLIIFMKKLRESFKISLIGSQHA